MRRRYSHAMKLALITGLVALNLVAAQAAFAHQWGSWSWNRSGSTVTIQIYNYATYRSQASSAITDWDSHTILSLPQVSSHTDVSVFDGNYGNTGWGGLAEIISSSGNYITHAHARLNYYYSYSSSDKQGIFCQEIGHTFGLTHSNDGCMGKGYYNNLNTTVSHNWNDIYNMYRYPH